MQQEALDSVVRKLRSGAAGSADAVAILRGFLPHELGSLADWQRLIGRALQTGRPVSVETTVKPRAEPEKTKGARSRRAPSGAKKKRTARKKGA